MYRVVQSLEPRDRPGADPTVGVLGTFATADEALVVARMAWRAFRAAGSDDYAHWVVKRDGSELAEWIADSRSNKEFVVDLRSGEFVQLRG